MSRTPPHPVRRGRLAAALAGGAAVCLAGGAHLLTEPARAAVANVGTVPGESTPTPSVTVQEVPPRRPLTTVPPTASLPSPALPSPALPSPALPSLALPPVALTAPALRTRATVVPVGTDAAGALELPEDPRTLGWWVGGAVPGAARGTVVVAGHVDTRTDGPGVMAAVARLPLGARLVLTDAAGRQRAYTVAAVRSYPKTALPASLFTSATTARLVLVTCGGTFDAQAHHYSDNVVVYAVPAAR